MAGHSTSPYKIMIKIPDYQLDKKDFLPVLIIFTLAMIFRVFYLKDLVKTSVYPVLPYSDGYSYYLWAKDIASGELLGNKAFMQWPLYAYVLGFLFKITANNVLLVYLFQFILGAVNCVLVYFIGKQLFNRIVGFTAGLMCAWYGIFIFHEGLLIYTSLSLFFNSLLFSRHSPTNLFLLSFFGFQKILYL